eukprot:1161746-Pelagomonas_calceolata.AAC.4
MADAVLLWRYHLRHKPLIGQQIGGSWHQNGIGQQFNDPWQTLILHDTALPLASQASHWAASW